MTGVLPRPAPAPAADSRPAARASDPADLCTWVLSVKDWRVHALARPSALPIGEVLATRCGAWHPVGCPVSVARRGEPCPRCAAGGVQRLELLPSREEDGTAAQ